MFRRAVPIVRDSSSRENEQQRTQQVEAKPIENCVTKGANPMIPHQLIGYEPKEKSSEADADQVPDEEITC